MDDNLYMLLGLVVYIIGYCFSFGAMTSIWETYAEATFFTALIMLFWPIWWVCYIPYRIAVRLFS